MTTVALDGHGAERGAEAIVAGARAAAADGIRLRVFGDPAQLAALDGIAGVELIAGRRARSPTTTTRSPRSARTPGRLDRPRRRRRRRRARSDAVVSAGSTGATMTAALFALKRMQGVRRPALALQLLVPAATGRPTLLLDVGANAEVRPSDLVQFAYLGAAFSAAVLGVARPRVALLSVGEEPKKGTADVVEAHAELAGAEGHRLRRQRRGPRPARRRRRRDRHRRVHRQRRPEDDRGHRAGRSPTRSAPRPARARSPPPAGCCCARRSAGCAGGWTPTRPAARSCSACAASRWSATAAPGADGIANAVRLAARAVEERRRRADRGAAGRAPGATRGRDA